MRRNRWVVESSVYDILVGVRGGHQAEASPAGLRGGDSPRGISSGRRTPRRSTTTPGAR
nr:hypothetical protein [Amycolatopsis marina]